MADEIDTNKDGVSPNVRRTRWLAHTEAILIARAQHTVTQVVEMSEIVDAFATHSIFSAYLRELWDRGLLLRPMWVRLIQTFFLPSPRRSLLLTCPPPHPSPFPSHFPSLPPSRLSFPRLSFPPLPFPLSAHPLIGTHVCSGLANTGTGLHCNISRLPVRQCCA